MDKQQLIEAIARALGGDRLVSQMGASHETERRLADKLDRVVKEEIKALDAADGLRARFGFSGILSALSMAYARAVVTYAMATDADHNQIADTAIAQLRVDLGALFDLAKRRQAPPAERTAEDEVDAVLDGDMIQIVKDAARRGGASKEVGQ